MESFIHLKLNICKVSIYKYTISLFLLYYFIILYYTFFCCRLNEQIMDRGESVQNKKYAVVKFILDNLYSEIPASWIIFDNNKNKSKCFWPPRTANTATLIANCASPNVETWHQYDIDFVKYSSKYVYALISCVCIFVINITINSN